MIQVRGVLASLNLKDLDSMQNEELVEKACNSVEMEFLKKRLSTAYEQCYEEEFTRRCHLASSVGKRFVSMKGDSFCVRQLNSSFTRSLQTKRVRNIEFQLVCGIALREHVQLEQLFDGN